MKKGEILEKVYKSNLPSRAKQIMFYLINRANSEGTCFPSVRTIARDCGISERTVQRSMKVLIETGFIVKENRYRDNGGQSSNLYKLQMEPESSDDKKVYSDKSKEKINEENTEFNDENKDELKNIEMVTFDGYLKENKRCNNNINEKKQAIFNILKMKVNKRKNHSIVAKCHPILFGRKIKKQINLKAIASLNFLCHGVSDNLCVP